MYAEPGLRDRRAVSLACSGRSVETPLNPVVSRRNASVHPLGKRFSRLAVLAPGNLGRLPGRERPWSTDGRRAVKRTSNAAEIAHNLGLAAWFGGTLFGQVALNPTVSSISDRRERGRVLNESWGRFNAANAPALLAWR